MLRIRYSHRKLKNEALKNRAEFHYERLNGNALYAGCQPLVTALGTLFSPFGTAIANCKLGGTDRTEAKNKIQRDIITALDGLGRKIEDGANAPGMAQEEGESLVRGGGFELVEKTTSVKKEVTFLNVPTGLKATDEKKQGAVCLEFDEQDNAITYLIEDSVDSQIWKIFGVTGASPIVLTGFPMKANRSFRFTSIGEGTLMSDKSETVTVWIS